MFEQAVLQRGFAGKRLWTTGLGMTGEALVLGLAVLIPMLSPEVLHRQELAAWIFQPPPVPPGPAQAPKAQPAQVAARPPRPADGQFHEPPSVPKSLPKPTFDLPEPGYTAVVGVPDGIGVPNGVPSGSPLTDLFRRTLDIPPVVRPPETHPAVTATTTAIPRIRQGGYVIEGKLVYHPQPIYPPLARAARIEGVVQLMGVIGVDGRMRELKVLSGHPLLVNAAVDAVRQWIYRPTSLNSVPVEVEAPITVTFKLN